MPNARARVPSAASARFAMQIAPEPNPSCVNQPTDACTRRREVVDVLADAFLQLLLRRQPAPPDAPPADAP